MIPRYTRKEMKRIWSEEYKFQKWLDVELASLEGWAKKGVIPQKAVDEIKRKAKIDVERINEIEKTTNHDVIAFVEQISESVGDTSRYIHYGLTSSDVLDTASALILKETGEILLQDMKELLVIFKNQALKYKDIVMMGRTHGVHAEPITLGFKIGGWYYEFLRGYERLKDAVENISVGKISGAVGTFSNITPDIEGYVCKKLGLKQELFSTQIIARDRHAYLLNVLGIIAASCEKIALQVRLMQQTETGEAAEFFAKGQKGSSAMPHKRNPIISERICGISRVIKKNAGVAMDNVALWYERDISHSSAERIILPESTILMNYTLHLLKNLIGNLDVYPDNMRRNINISNEVFFSQKILSAFVMKGVLRKDAYELIQQSAFDAKQNNKSFSASVKSNEGIMKYFTEDAMDEIFNMKILLKNLDILFKILEDENPENIC